MSRPEFGGMTRKCRVCGGSGRYFYDKCAVCGGTGYERKRDAQLEAEGQTNMFKEATDG